MPSPEPAPTPPEPTTARDCWHRLADLADQTDLGASQLLRQEGDAAGDMPCTLPALRTALTFLSGSGRPLSMKATPPGVGARRQVCAVLSGLLFQVRTSSSVRPVHAVMLRLRDHHRQLGNAVEAERADREARDLATMLGAT